MTRVRVFFEMCNIKANPNKYDLLVLNSEEEEVELGDNIIVRKIERLQIIRFLGVFLEEI